MLTPREPGLSDLNNMKGMMELISKTQVLALKEVLFTFSCILKSLIFLIQNACNGRQIFLLVEMFFADKMTVFKNASQKILISSACILLLCICKQK